MAAFKQHCSSVFWRGEELFGDDPDRSPMGQFGRIITLANPPSYRRINSLIKQALSTLESFTYSNQKDFIEWLNEAKRAGTQHKPLATTIECLSEDKGPNLRSFDC